MKLDSTDSRSIAMANNDSEQENENCPELLLCADWCYMFVHHTKVQLIKARIEAETPYQVFIHTTVVDERKKSSDKRNPESGTPNVKSENGGRTQSGDANGISSDLETKPTISGLIFIQGDVQGVKKYLQGNFTGLYLAKDCATGETAVIRDSVMQPFMRLMKLGSSQIRFMLKHITEYAKGNPLLRITSGIFEGLEGYVVRIDRDRKLVMAVGNMTVAVSGVHKESFEKVEDYDNTIAMLK